MLYQSTIPGFDWMSNINPEWWWFVLGFFGLISVIFFLVVVYHWLRYETNAAFSMGVIVVNAVVLALLLGGATATLSSYLATL